MFCLGVAAGMALCLLFQWALSIGTFKTSK